MRLCSSTTTSSEMMSKSLCSSSSVSVSSAPKEAQAEEGQVRGGGEEGGPFLSFPEQKEEGEQVAQMCAQWLRFWEETGAEAPSLRCAATLGECISCVLGSQFLCGMDAL